MFNGTNGPIVNVFYFFKMSAIIFISRRFERIADLVLALTTLETYTYISRYWDQRFEINLNHQK